MLGLIGYYSIILMFLFIIHSDHRETLYKYFGLIAMGIDDLLYSLKNTCNYNGLDWVLSQYSQHYKKIEETHDNN